MSEVISISQYLQGKPISVIFRPGNQEHLINNFNELREYVLEQNNFWANHNYSHIANQNTMYSQITSIVHPLNDQTFDKNIERIIGQVQNELSNASLLSSRSPAIIFIDKYSNNNKNIFLGFLIYILNINLEDSNHFIFLGRLLGFIYQDMKLIDDFSSVFIPNRFDEILDKYEKEINEKSLENTNINIEQKIAVDKLISENNKWQNEKGETIRLFFEEKREKINQLEKLYEEKLRIEGPASFWEKYRIKYKKSSIFFTSLSTLIGATLISIIIFLIQKMPNQIFNGSQLNIENTLKWTILLALLFSIGIYVLRTFIKIAFSSMHLSRDADERFQLTHIYLSFLKEKAIDEKQREIILQALFSRADTGLLKGDSSPTMPDSIISQILKNISR
jgi:hypothetical protein